MKITILFLVFGAVYSSTEKNDSLDKIQVQTNYPHTSIDKILPQQALEMNQNNNAANQNNEIVPYNNGDYQLAQKLEAVWQAEHAVAKIQEEENEDEENQNCCQKWFIEKNEKFQDHIWNTRYYLKEKKCGKKCRKALKIAFIPVALPIAMFMFYPEITSAIIWLILQFGVKPNNCKKDTDCTTITNVQHVFLATFLIGLFYRIAQRIGKKVDKKVDRFMNPLAVPSPKKKPFWNVY